MPEVNCAKNANLLGSFSIYEQPKWERIVASTQVGFRVSIWVRIRVWIRVRDRVRVRIRVRVRVRVRLGLYFGCSYIEKGPRFLSDEGPTLLCVLSFFFSHQ